MNHKMFNINWANPKILVLPMAVIVMLFGLYYAASSQCPVDVGDRVILDDRAGTVVHIESWGKRTSGCMCSVIWDNGNREKFVEAYFLSR